MTAPDAGTAEYATHLGRLLDIHAPLEAELARLTPLADFLPDLRARWKTPALAHDLGRCPPASSGPGRTLLARFDLYPLEDPARALGALYVLEGATLGGRVLLGRLRSRGIVPGPIGTRYLEGYGAETGRRWRAFLDALEPAGTRFGRGPMVAGAVAAFDALAHGFEA